MFLENLKRLYIGDLGIVQRYNQERDIYYFSPAEYIIHSLKKNLVTARVTSWTAPATASHLQGIRRLRVQLSKAGRNRGGEAPNPGERKASLKDVSLHSAAAGSARCAATKLRLTALYDCYYTYINTELITR